MAEALNAPSPPKNRVAEALSVPVVDEPEPSDYFADLEARQREWQDRPGEGSGITVAPAAAPLPGYLGPNQIMPRGEPYPKNWQTSGYWENKKTGEKYSFEDVEKRPEIRDLPITYVSPTQPQAERMPIKDEFATGVQRGMLQMGSSMRSLMGMGADKLGQDKFAQRMMEAAKSDIERTQDPDLAASIQSLYQVKNAGDFVHWLAGAGGEQLPILTSFALSGSASGIPGAVGTMATAAGLEAGSVGTDIYSEYGLIKPEIAATYGTIAGLLDALPVMRIMKKTGGGKVGQRQVLNRLKKMGYAQAMTQEGFKQMVLEGGTEGIQTIIEQAALHEVDANRKWFTDQDIEEIVNATALGGIMGKAMGMPAGIGVKQAATQQLAAQDALEAKKGYQPPAGPKIVQPGLRGEVSAVREALTAPEQIPNKGIQFFKTDQIAIDPETRQVFRNGEPTYAILDADNETYRDATKDEQNQPGWLPPPVASQPEPTAGDTKPETVRPAPPAVIDKELFEAKEEYPKLSRRTKAAKQKLGELLDSFNYEPVSGKWRARLTPEAAEKLGIVAYAKDSKNNPLLSTTKTARLEEWVNLAKEPPAQAEPRGEAAAAPTAGTPPKAASAEPEGAAAGKQLWEMTKKEWLKVDKRLATAKARLEKTQQELGKGDRWGEARRFQGKAAGLRLERLGKARESWSKAYDAAEKKHKIIIQSAIKQGKPVPRAVLEEYQGEKWADEALAKLGAAGKGPKITVTRAEEEPGVGDPEGESYRTLGSIAPEPAAEGESTDYQETIEKYEQESQEGSFLENVTPATVGKFKAAMDALLQITFPARRGEPARTGANITRKRLAEMAQSQESARQEVKKMHQAFFFMSKENILEFIDRMENGRRQESPKLEMISQVLSGLLERRLHTIQNLGKEKLKYYYEHYFPHLWKNHYDARRIINEWLHKRTLRGKTDWLKHRDIPTVKMGVEMGLEPISWNPIDLALTRLLDEDRYIMLQGILKDLKEKNLTKFVFARMSAPEGWMPFTDPALTVMIQPEIHTKEAYDKLLVENLMSIAESLGIHHERLPNLPGGAWGKAYGDTGIATRFAGPESALIHEIGHIIGTRYNVFNWMEDVLMRKQEGEFKRITRGKRKGQRRFVPTAEAIDQRRIIQKELRDLTDARFEGQKASPAFRKYVRKRAEKEAVLLEAFLHAPEKMKKIAPTLYRRFKEFLNNRAELRPLLDVAPSLVVEERVGESGKLPGELELGKYYSPEPVATLINNYLSPGLRNNKNKAIAIPYNLLRGMGNILNQANLALSMFHGLNTTTDVMASHVGLGLREILESGRYLGQGKPAKAVRSLGAGLVHTVTAPIAPLPNLWRGHKLIGEYRKDLDKIEDPHFRQLVESVIAAGGRSQLDPYYYNRAIQTLTKTLSDLFRGALPQRVKAAVRLPWDAATSALELAAKPLLEWLVPRQKFGLFAIMAQHEMDRHETKDLSDEQLHESLSQVWDSVDNRMGQLVYDNLFWNKTLKDALMLAVRSVGWNLGSWREYGGAPIDILTTKQRLERGDAYLSHKIGYTMGAVTIYAVLGAVISYILTGNPPEDPKDYFFPKTGQKNPDGSDERISLPTYAKDWFAYSEHPLTTIKHKLHPLWALFSEMWNNEDYYGTEIRNEDDPIVAQLKDLAEYVGKSFLPFSVRNYMRMREAGHERAEAAATSASGIVSAPAYVARTRAHKLMIKYIVERLPKGSRTKEQYERAQAVRRVKDKLRAGESLTPDDTKLLSPSQLARAKREAELPPFGASFKRLSFAEALNVYVIANQTEREQVRDILIDKYQNTGSERPEFEAEEKLYWELLPDQKVLGSAKKDPSYYEISALIRERDELLDQALEDLDTGNWSRVDKRIEEFNAKHPGSRLSRKSVVERRKNKIKQDRLRPEIRAERRVPVDIRGAARQVRQKEQP